MTAITIPNWNKFNPRTDRTITVWFRFQNTFFEDQNLWGLSDSAKLLFIFVLCEASKIQKETVGLNLDYIAAKRRCTLKQAQKDLDALFASGVLRPPVGGQTPDEIPATRQDKQTRQTEQEATGSPRLHELALCWNENSGSLHKVAECGPSRTKKAASRMAEATLEEWGKVIRMISLSKFCLGENDRGWAATFDWLLQPETRVKVLEGKYENRIPVARGPKPINYGAPAEFKKLPNKENLKPIGEILGGLSVMEAVKQQKARRAQGE